MDYQWDVDMVFMMIYIKENDGYGFFVLVIDIFFWFLWMVFLCIIKGLEMLNVLKLVFDQGRILDYLRMDKGVEFKNRIVQKLIKDLEIKQFYI